MAKRDFSVDLFFSKARFFGFLLNSNRRREGSERNGVVGPNFTHGDPNYNRAASAKCRWSRAVCGFSPSASAALRGRRRLLLLRERASQRVALLPGARAHCISVGRSAVQQRGCVSDTTGAAPPRSSRGAHSITSSARASTVVGISSPSVFAVLRLTTSSYLVGACTGRSAGFSPLRMRST